MKKFILTAAALLASLSITACSSTQLAAVQANNANIVNTLKVACQIDGVAQPIAVTVADGTGNAALTIGATVDSTLVHPAVVAACAKLNATPVSATVVSSTTTATPAPTATTTN